MPDHKIVLKVSGMTCGGCVATVKKALEAIAGVDEAVVDLQAGTAEVTVGDDDITPDQLVMAVKLAGFDARVM